MWLKYWDTWNNKYPVVYLRASALLSTKMSSGILHSVQKTLGRNHHTEKGSKNLPRVMNEHRSSSCPDHRNDIHSPEPSMNPFVCRWEQARNERRKSRQEDQVAEQDMEEKCSSGTRVLWKVISILAIKEGWVINISNSCRHLFHYIVSFCPVFSKFKIVQTPKHPPACTVQKRAGEGPKIVFWVIKKSSL